ncbi:MAG: hypothetical protein U0263_37690 [Polyangiaceae bacterium]
MNGQLTSVDIDALEEATGDGREAQHASGFVAHGQCATHLFEVHASSVPGGV